MENITPQELAAHPTVVALATLQDQQGLSDASFVKTARLGYSPSTWSRVKAGKYGVASKILPSLEASLSRARVTLATAENRYVLFDHISTALAAVDIARATSGPIRIVFFVGPTGSGKTHFANQLREQYDASYVEAAPSWRKSYLAALGDIAEQLGIPGEFRSVRAAERAVLQALKVAPRTLVIDEGNYFSQEGLNFLKLILNRTRSSIVLCTLPTDFNRMLRETAHEANQLVRRAVAIIRVPTVSTADVNAMAKIFWPGKEVGAYAPKVAESANRFGRYDFVRRVFDEADPEEPEDLLHAIARVKEQINTQPVAA